MYTVYKCSVHVPELCAYGTLGRINVAPGESTLLQSALISVANFQCSLSAMLIENGSQDSLLLASNNERYSGTLVVYYL